MPLYNFDSLSKVLEVVYLEGTILEIDATNETAKVKFELGSNGTKEKDSIPFYYHCYDSAKLNSRGGLEYGYIPFKKDDKVIVACALSDPMDLSSFEPIHIIAFSSGIKPCFYVYFVSMDRSTTGWCLVPQENDKSKYKLQNDSKPEFYPRVVIKGVSLDPIEISQSKSSRRQVFGVFLHPKNPSGRWNLLCPPEYLSLDEILDSKDGFSINSWETFGKSVLAITTCQEGHSCQYLNMSYSEGDFGEVFAVVSTLGSMYCDPVRTYLGHHFGFAGFCLTYPIPKYAYFLHSMKVLNDSVAVQPQGQIAGSRWSSKPMFITQGGYPLLSYTASAEGGNKVLYSDSNTPPCHYIRYYPFALLGKAVSIYIKREFDLYAYVSNGKCSGAGPTQGTLFVALTVPVNCFGTTPRILKVWAERRYVPLYRQMANIKDILYLGERIIDWTTSSGIRLASNTTIECDLNWFMGCGIDIRCTPVYFPETSIKTRFSEPFDSVNYTDETLAVVAYDGFLREGKPYAIFVYAKHKKETFETYLANEYEVGFYGYGGVFYEAMAESVSADVWFSRTEKHTYDFYLCIVFGGEIKVHNSIGRISGTYERTWRHGYYIDDYQTYNFKPGFGTIPTCISCQISSYGAVWTYLLYKGNFPEGMPAGGSQYLRGTKRVIGIASSGGSVKRYSGESDVESILKNVMQGDSTTIDLSINPSSLMAVGILPGLRDKK